MKIREALKKCKEILASANIENADFEARCLAEKALGLECTRLVARSQEDADEKSVKALFSLARRRAKREPLQYILGSWTFCGFEFFVGQGVLIPRDDTEVVTRLCVRFLESRRCGKVLDLCAGSGAICVALAKLARADVTAVELNRQAFEYLLKNIRHNKAKVKAVLGDITKCGEDFPDGEFDLIVSNPPYIISSEIENLQKEVLFEPKSALDGGDDGLFFYREIISKWSAKLKTGGALAFELGENQAGYVSSLMKKSGFENIETAPDLGNTDRAVIGIKSS